MMEPSTHSHDQNQRGYSLAEVLVATAIFTIIFVAALMIYDRSNKVFKESVEAGDLQQQVRVSFDRLVADVRMTGFDFDRDGIPSGAQKYQQPDEQIEYMGPSALTIRGNFDAELEAANDNGREEDYEPPAGQFPVVTTGNDEIVTYALKSVSGPNNDKIEFYADTRKPRATYLGGEDERLVTISGVDLCTSGCMNPPYTLYRITLRDADLASPVASDLLFTPLADNIRSIRFDYFQDHRGTVAITPNGGAGQYKVQTPMLSADMAARTLRESVNSIRIEVVGMNSQSTFGYSSPVETALAADKQVASAKSYRQYRLESLVVPRNIGLRGMQEFDMNPPGKPKILSLTGSGCGVVKVAWEAPTVGIVDSYALLYDTSAAGPFGSTPLYYGQALQGFVQGLDPNETYYFIVVAQNSHGSQRSDVSATGIKPINPTQPAPPLIVDVSGPAGSPMKELAIDLRAKLPTTNVDPYDVDSDGVALPEIPLPVKGEMTAFRVYRSEVQADVGEQIWPAATAPSPLAAPIPDVSGNLTFTDNSPLVSCRDYFYRVAGVEQACAAADALNAGTPVPTGGLKMIAVSPNSEPSAAGRATTSAKPAKASVVNFIGASSCSVDPCSIELQWPQVVLDVNGKAIYAPEYIVKRVTATAAGPISGTEVPVTVIDTNFADNVMGYTDAPAQPPSGMFYAYSVAAQQTGGADCTLALPGEFSDPRNFPCIQMSVSPPSLGWIDGDGSMADPWLVSAPWGSIGVKATLPIAQVSGKLYDMAGNLITTVVTPGVIGPDTAVLDVPLTSNNGATYRFDITVADATGCANTEVRFLTDAVTGCCLAPYKDAGGSTFDATIVTAVGTSSDVYDVKLRNLCDDGLTLKAVRIGWPTTGNPDLETVAFPPISGTTQVVVAYGSNVQPATITVPATALSAIGGDSSTYVIRLDFSKSINKDSANFTVVPIYDRAAPSEVNTNCRIVQTPF